MLAQQDDPNPRPDDTAACKEALRLLALGLWPIAISSPFAHTPNPGKRPIGSAWGVSRNTPATLRAMYASNYDAGVGIVLGEQGGVIDVEFDSVEDADTAFSELMGGELVETKGWSSRRGRHHLFRYDARLEKYGKSKFYDFRYRGVEVRIGALAGETKQVQSVVPPSLMSEVDADGKIVSLGPRTWNGVDTIATLPDAFFVLADRIFAERMASKSNKSSTSSDQPQDEAVRKYALAALDREVQALRSAGEGGRNNQLNRSAFAIGQLVGAGALDRVMAEGILRATAIGIGLGPDEVEATIRSGVDDGFDNPRDLSGVGRAERGDAFVGSGKGKPEADDEPAPEPTIEDDATAADLLEAQAGIRWTWPGWIQRGVLCLLASEPGTGKTRLGMDLAKRLAHALPWPDGSPNEFPAGSRTLWVAADNQHSELATLPVEFGFDPGLVFLNALKANPYGGTDLANQEQLDDLEARIKRVNPVLVIIDTITQTSDFKSHDSSDAKRQFKPLQEIAKRCDTSILCVTHLNSGGKTLGRRADEKVRTAIRLERPDPDGQPNRRKLWVSKSNSLAPPALGITMGADGNQYDANPPVAPDDAGGGAFVGPAKTRSAPKTEMCVEWMKGVLKDGAMKLSDIRRDASGSGFANCTFQAAKQRPDFLEFEAQGVIWIELKWEFEEDNP